LHTGGRVATSGQILMRIIKLLRDSILGSNRFGKERPIAVTEEEFLQLLKSGAIEDVEIPFRELLPKKYRHKSWFQLRQLLAGKIGKTTAKGLESAAERLGIPIVLIKFLNMDTHRGEKKDGADNHAG
jgi:hypothetical protein